MSTLTRIQLVLALLLRETLLAVPVWSGPPHRRSTFRYYGPRVQIRFVLSIRRQPRNTGSYIRRLPGRDKAERRTDYRFTEASGLRSRFGSGKTLGSATHAWDRGSGWVARLTGGPDKSSIRAGFGLFYTAIEDLTQFQEGVIRVRAGLGFSGSLVFESHSRTE